MWLLQLTVSKECTVQKLRMFEKVGAKKIIIHPEWKTDEEKYDANIAICAEQRNDPYRIYSTNLLMEFMHWIRADRQ